MEFRTFQPEDELHLAQTIRDTWHYDRLSPNLEVALLMGKIYLYGCLARQTFHRVAVAEGRPVGIIMGYVEGKQDAAASAYRAKLEQYYEEMQQHAEGQFILKMFETFEHLDEEMLTEIGKEYDGELVFFVIDASVRGQHVGAQLYQQFLQECQANHCQNIYVYTDETCNFGFYEHQGFRRMNQRLHEIQQHRFQMFVYENELNR